MQYNIFVILGSNKSSSSMDTKHKFNMTPFFEEFKNIYWAHNVRNEEVLSSTPFYEAMKTADYFVETNGVNPNNINFCFSRGTFGKVTERFIEDKLILLNDYSVKSKNIFITKSFGVIDALKVIKKLKNIDIDLFIALDGYAPFWARSKTTTKYKKSQLQDDPNGQRHRFNILGNFKKYYAIVQREDRIQGFKFGNPNQRKSFYHNYTIKPSDVKLYPNYSGYSDGYIRDLKISHNDMEELCSILPCCYDNESGNYLNVNKTLLKELLA